MDLNRTLRPTTWNQITGQDSVKEICQKALAEGKFPKFSIFHGPTGVGKSCIAELIARQLTAWTGNIDDCPNIHKYNMAALAGKKDIIEVISNIFKYKSMGTTVYILEEVHVLKKEEEQTPFLEELTRIPDNVYVIMCTTRVSSMISPLKNRATLFQLTLPSLDDCKDYIDNILDTLHFSPMSDKAKVVLIKSSNFTPRSIVKHIELLSSGDSVNEEDINKFFHTISNETCIKVLHYLINTNISMFQCMNALREIVADNYSTNLMSSLRDFTIQLLLEKASGQLLIPATVSERTLIKEYFDIVGEETFVRIFTAMNKIDFYHLETAEDTLAVCISLKLALSNKTPQAIVASNKALSSEALIENKRLARQQMPVKSSIATAISAISLDSDLSAFGVEEGTLFEE